MAEITTIIKYLEEEKEYKFINNYQTFLNTCYKAFDMSEEEKKSLKIFLIDEDGDEISIDSVMIIIIIIIIIIMKIIIQKYQIY